MKYANILSSRPYEMIVASRELLSWVHGSYKEEPPLDISYCNLHARKKRFSLILKTSVAGSPNIVMENIMPVGLEPVMGPVAVKHTASTSSHVKAGSSASSEALFVYPLASTLVTEHGMAWGAAIEHAKTCYRRFPKPSNGSLAVCHDGVRDGDVDGEHALAVMDGPFRSNELTT